MLPSSESCREIHRRNTKKGSSLYPTFLWRKTMLLFDDDLLDNETDVIKSDGKRSIIYHVYGC